MPGQSEPDDIEPKPPAKLHEKDRQRDGNAFPVVENLVDIAVRAVVVLGVVAVEAKLPKKMGAQGRKFLLVRWVGCLVTKLFADIAGNGIDELEVRLHLEIGIVDLRKEEGAFDEIDFLLFLPEKLAKLLFDGPAMNEFRE